MFSRYLTKQGWKFSGFSPNSGFVSHIVVLRLFSQCPLFANCSFQAFFSVSTYIPAKAAMIKSKSIEKLMGVKILKLMGMKMMQTITAHGT